MAWLYVPEAVVSKRAYRSSCQINTRLFVLSKGRPTPLHLSWRGWKRRDWLRVLSGITLRPSTANLGVLSWISSLVAIRASLSVSPENVSENVTRAIYGLTSGGLCAKLLPDSSFSKTSQLTLPLGSTPLKQTSKALATELKLEYSVRQKRVRLMKESDYLSSENWPTPTTGEHRGDSPSERKRHAPCLASRVINWTTPKAIEGRDCPSERARTTPGLATQAKWATPAATDGNRGGTITENMSGQSLPQMMNSVSRWPTPTVNGNNNRADLSPKAGNGLSTAVKAWPTPTSSEHKYRLKGGSQQSNCLAAVTRKDILKSGQQVQDKSNIAGSTQGQLNPAWVEQLMGWVPGQSNFACSETEWSLWLRRWRLYLFGEKCGCGDIMNKDLNHTYTSNVGLWPTPCAQKNTPSSKSISDLLNSKGGVLKPGEKPHSPRTGKPIQTCLADVVRFWPADVPF